jgi:hypothetical protein
VSTRKLDHIDLLPVSTGVKRSFDKLTTSTWQPHESRKRAVEIGFIKSKIKFTIYMLYTGFPVWLLGLDTNAIQHLVLAPHSDLDSATQAIRSEYSAELADLFTLLIHRIGIERVEFQTVFSPSSAT